LIETLDLRISGQVSTTVLPLLANSNWVYKFLKNKKMTYKNFSCLSRTAALLARAMARSSPLLLSSVGARRTAWGQCYKTFYGCNLQMGQISWVFCPWQAYLWVRPGSVFTTLHFLCNLWISPIRKSVTQYLAGKAWQFQTL
jgi:hypothetical protein